MTKLLFFTHAQSVSSRHVIALLLQKLIEQLSILYIMTMFVRQVANALLAVAEKCRSNRSLTPLNQVTAVLAYVTMRQGEWTLPFASKISTDQTQRHCCPSFIL
jgi:hypothetical protein